MMLRWILPLVVGVFGLLCPAMAQETPKHYSQCHAIAQAVPGTMFARLDHPEHLSREIWSVAAADYAVRLTFVGHSTFFIETPEGVTIATDYNGYVKPPVLPRIATMNRAHTTHFTLAPEAGIEMVLHGWSDVDGKKAQHSVVVDDTFIRNVTSDIRGSGGFEKDGNSIFIFEVAGLCIGHLGHLHQELSEGQYAEIGRLDVVMVPVDGGLTMGSASMSRVVQRLRSSLILPMHRPGPSMANFLAMMGSTFAIEFGTSNTVEVSLNTLPKKPLVLVVPGMQ